MSDIFDLEQPSYKRFRAIYKERTRNVVIWVGSGLSKPAGLPDWEGLKNILLNEGYAKANSLNIGDRENYRNKIDAIKKIQDYWNLFEALKDVIGDESYAAAIKHTFALADTVKIPNCYNKLWNLNIGGIITVNIDRLVARAFHQNVKDKALHEFCGREAGNNIKLLKSEVPFILNAHGIKDDTSTWVFTKSQIKHLLEDEGYGTFIKTIFASRTVIFIGITALDFSTGGLLGNLRNVGIDAGEHFWLTNIGDYGTDQLAKKNGLQVIRYSSAEGHEKPLDIFIQDIENYLPQDIPATPIRPEITEEHIKETVPSDIANKEPEVIRQILNAQAFEILKGNDKDAYDKYEQFYNNYERAIWNSWYVTDKTPNNILMGYKITSMLHTSGAFGHVYKAVDADGNELALKILKYEISKNKNTLGCFRRGVKSMNILSGHQVKGMVPYKKAFEIPAFVVMDFIKGMNLEQVIESRLLTDWNEKLFITYNIAKIIRQGHLLPERVLHRDIRPANIMLSNYPGKDWDVVVLDFDLSWHKDAMEFSLDFSTSSALGFLAPEQLEDIKGVSTRNAAVDSFGLGMTLYYLFTGKKPIAGIYRKPEWSQYLKRDIAFKQCTIWASLPIRLARLIERATKYNQNERIDMGQIESELSRLYDIVYKSEIPRSAELWVDEIMYSAMNDFKYEWNYDKLCAKRILVSGVELTLYADEIHNNVNVNIRLMDTGIPHQKNIQKYLGKMFDECKAQLSRGHWQINRADIISKKEIVFDAEIKIDDLINYKKDTIGSISYLCSKLEYK